MKYDKTQHYKSKDNIYNIYINWYTTKSGYLKFNIQVTAELTYNNSGFCSEIANYNTKDNNLINYLKFSDDFILIDNF